MKLRLPLLFAAFVMITGCEKIKDATSVKVDTGFEVDFPVTVTTTKTTNASVFSVSEEISLADNSDLQDYLSKIDEITLSNLVITVSGLTEGQTINSLSLDATGVGNVLTLTNITMANNSFTPEISASVLDQMGDKLQADEALTLTVSGETSGPMTFLVSCNMDARVVVETL
jgi:hypothetical protein